MRVASSGETPAILQFLMAHEATSMFPIGNLLGQGPPTESWLFTDANRITGYLGLTDQGILLPQAPMADWANIRQTLAGKRVSGIVGPCLQARALRSALGLAATPARLDKDETGYSLALNALHQPDCTGFHLSEIHDSSLELVTSWRKAALIETMGFTPQTAGAEAGAQVLAWQSQNRHRILWQDQTPLALAGFNAEIPGAVQVGGVYTPPELRNRGYSRRAVGLGLAEARARGILRAYLFTSSLAAARAYTALGFHRSHDFTLLMFAAAQEVTGP